MRDDDKMSEFFDELTEAGGVLHFRALGQMWRAEHMGTSRIEESEAAIERGDLGASVKPADLRRFIAGVTEGTETDDAR